MATHRLDDAWGVRWLLVVTLATAGCFAPRSTLCSDGRTCPAGTSCDVAHHSCTTATTELTACAGHAEGDDCTLLRAPGKCRAGVCQPLRCGDGVRSSGEACEGNDLGGQTCAGLHFYGQTRGLSCNSDCTLNTGGCTGYCGDGMVNGPEQCDGVPFTPKTCLDYGFDMGPVGCSDTCTVALESCAKFGGWSVAPVSLSGEQLRGVWGSGLDDVYAAGPSTVLHWNGTSWSDGIPAIAKGMAASSFSVWGTGPSDVYLGARTTVGLTVFHWDGAAWTAKSAPEVGTPLAVWASGPNDVYVAGYSLWHWDGNSWSVSIADAFQSVWGSGPNDVFALGGHISTPKHWDGSAWSDLVTPLGHTYSRVWGTRHDDLFGVGPAGVIDHWDGSVWTPMTSGVTSALAAISGSGHANVVAIGTDGTILTFDGTSWKKTAPVMSRYLADVWVGQGSAFAVGNGIVSWNPDRWGTLPFDGTPPVLNAVWSSAPDDLFAVGDGGTLAHWDGASWSTTALDPTLAMRAVWGNGPDDVLAVGDNAADDPVANLAHWDGVRWSRPPVAPSIALPGTLRGVWSSGPTNVYLVGESQGLSCVLHWDGTAWTTLADAFPPPPSLPMGGPPFPHPGFGAPLAGVWGSGPNDVYVFGEVQVSHWDGTRWTLTGRGATAMWGSTARDVYGVSGPGPATGSIDRWDGTRWWHDMPSYMGFHAVGGSTAGDVLAAGDDLLMHRRAGIWEPIKLPVAGSIRGLWVTPSRVTLVGTMGELHLDRASMTCVGPERNCNDGWDNDCDGLTDIEDPDCAGKVAEQCANTLDDDGDGAIDCADPDCASFPICKHP